MSRSKKTRIAFIYDFDGTLSPKNMQEYNFFPKLKIASKKFWQEAKDRAKKNEADEILSYMTLMLEKSKSSSSVKINKDAFVRYGKHIDLFPGVESWFQRINAYAKEKKLAPHHFIISSGIREMIEGTVIAKKFSEIYASSFIYDQHDVAIWPGLAINYTTKTQFLFRINKGVLNVWDNERINGYVPQEERDVPFENMIFIGDGSTDVPCMKLVKELGGFSIAVYPPNKSSFKAKSLLKQDRVHAVIPADYSKDKELEGTVLSVIDKVSAVSRLKKKCK